MREKGEKVMEKFFKILVILKNVICWCMIAILVISLVIAMSTKINGSTPTIFGYSIMRVSSGSMEPELMVGDVILDKMVKNTDTIEVGDVITFQGSGVYDGMLITHKVIKAPYNDNGVMMLQTRGIANDMDDEPIRRDSVIGIMVCKIPYLDTLYNVFLSPWGLIILLVLIILVFIDELINIVKILTGNDRDEEPEDINEIIERIQAENLKEMLDKKEEATKE